MKKFENQKEKIESTKRKIKGGTHSVSSNFKPRKEEKYVEKDLPVDSELYKAIEKVIEGGVENE